MLQSLEMQTFLGYRASELKDCVKHIHRLYAIVSAEEGDLQQKYYALEVWKLLIRDKIKCLG